MTRISFLLILVILSYVILRKKFIVNLVIGSLFYILFLSLHRHSILIPDSFVAYINYLLYPGTSLKPIRAFISYASTMVVLFCCIGFRNNIWFFRATIGITLAVCYTWANDFVISSVIGVILLLLFNRIKLIEIIKIILLSIAISFIFLSIISDFNYFQFIDYNFNGVRKDQWWYFTPYFHRVFSCKDLLYLLYNDHDDLFPNKYNNLYSIALTIILFISYIYTKNVKYGACVVLLVVNFLGGAISTIGGHLSNLYFYNFAICAFLVTFFICVDKIILISTKYITSIKKCKTFSILFITVICVMLSYLCLMTNSRNNLLIANNEDYVYVDSFGGYLSKEYSRYLDFVRTNLNNKKFVEEFYGLASAYFNIKPLWKVDSVIHVLGSKLRTDSLKAIDSVDYAITTRRIADESYQSWTFTENYWFYKTILQNFKPVFYGPLTIVWQRTNYNGVKLESSNCVLKKDSFVIDDKRKGFYEVSIGYEVPSLRTLLLLQNNISYFGFMNASLDINSSYMEFPIYFDGKNNVFKSLVLPKSNKSKVKLFSCTAKFYNVTNSRLFKFN